MWPDRVLNPGSLTYESGALPTALRGPAAHDVKMTSYLRRCDVMTSHRGRYDVILALYAHGV